MSEDDIIEMMDSVLPYTKILTMYEYRDDTKSYHFLWYFIRGDGISKINLMVLKSTFKQDPEYYTKVIVSNAQRILNVLKMSERNNDNS